MGLAQGVSEALIATACGLAISIVALASYSFFRGRVQKYIGELEAAATHLVALLHGQTDRQALSRVREDHIMPVPSLLGTERQDLHGI
jgi:biopolymer transport protein ExbB